MFRLMVSSTTLLAIVLLVGKTSQPQSQLQQAPQVLLPIPVTYVWNDEAAFFVQDRYPTPIREESHSATISAPNLDDPTTQPERRRAILKTLRRNASRVRDSARGKEVLDLLGLRKYEPTPGVTLMSLGSTSEYNFDCDCSLSISKSNAGPYPRTGQIPDWALGKVTDISFWTWEGRQRVRYSISDGFQEPRLPKSHLRRRPPPQVQRP